MVTQKTYLIPVEEGDLESLVGRCLEKAFKTHYPTPAPAPEADELLTPKETASLLKVSVVTVWQWSKPVPGILNPRRIGNQVRYLRSEVMAAAHLKNGKAA